jgi:KAP-like P-loop domain-containing protein
MAIATTGAPYETFTVLLDDPAERPTLGFDIYAEALAQMVQHSRPRFAIGIFGDWGSGKTTLMRAIEERVRRSGDTLLDTLRDALVAWSDEYEAEPGRARQAATMFGRAARALLRGLTIKGGLPGIEATFALEKVLDASGAADRPGSFYHAAFKDMREATADFSDDGRRRIVVFVDDLDRCLPASALQVLESMKLFFDLEGFVFVVGLDRSVIERSIEAKYQAGVPAQPAQVILEHAPAIEPGGADDRARLDARAALRAGQSRAQRMAQAPISGADYIKKIFQVSFALPRIGTSQLDELLTALSRIPGLPEPQGTDLRTTVQPHLVYMTDRDALNPREVKRLLNAYTLQMKLLHPRLRDDLSADTVLAIQLMAFRPDWEALYEALARDPDQFVSDMGEALAHVGGGPITIGDEADPVPQSFLAYARGLGAPLLTQESLTPYVSSAEQLRSTDTGSLHARKAISRLRRVLRGLDPRTPVDAGPALEEVGALRQAFSGSAASVPALLDAAIAETELLERELKALSGKQAQDATERIEASERILDRIADIVREMRRGHN